MPLGGTMHERSVCVKCGAQFDMYASQSPTECFKCFIERMRDQLFRETSHEHGPFINGESDNYRAGYREGHKAGARDGYNKGYETGRAEGILEGQQLARLFRSQPASGAGLDQDLLKEVIALCHPDRHPNRPEVANRVTAELLKMRKKRS